MLGRRVILWTVWSFTVLTILLGGLIMLEGVSVILAYPKIIKNIVRVWKLALAKIQKLTKKTLRFSGIAIYIVSRLVFFLGTAKLKRSLVSILSSEFSLRFSYGVKR